MTKCSNSYIFLKGKPASSVTCNKTALSFLSLTLSPKITLFFHCIYLLSYILNIHRTWWSFSSFNTLSDSSACFLHSKILCQYFPQCKYFQMNFLFLNHLHSFFIFVIIFILQTVQTSGLKTIFTTLIVPALKRFSTGCLCFFFCFLSFIFVLIFLCKVFNHLQIT